MTPPDVDPGKMPDIFLDNDQGNKILAAALRAFGLKVVCLQERFEPNAPDYEWIPQIASEGFLIVTSDKGLESDPENYQAMLSSKAKIVILDENNTKAMGWASAIIVSRHWFPFIISCSDRTVVFSLKNTTPLHYNPRIVRTAAASARETGSLSN